MENLSNDRLHNIDNHTYSNGCGENVRTRMGIDSWSLWNAGRRIYLR